MSEIPSTNPNTLTSEPDDGWQAVAEQMHEWHPALQEHARHQLAARGMAPILPGIQVEVDTAPESKLGLLSADQYKARLSETLKDNPEAQLDELQEINAYFGRQDQAYVAEIEELARDQEQLSDDVKLIVTIVAYGEGSRIRKTLEEYAKQDIDPRLFEIVVLDNHPQEVEDDNTLSEIELFKNDHPDISVVAAHKIWDESNPKTVGNARKYAFDLSLYRIAQRAQNSSDTILVCNDADATAIKENYLSSILAELTNHPDEDALVTYMDIPPEALSKPNVAASFLVLEAFDEALTEGRPGIVEPEPASINGRSSAFRAAAYAAVGGFNPKAVIAEDSELGWLISDARNWDPRRVTRLTDTTLVTDPRRYIDATVNRIPVDQMLLDFQTKPKLRSMNNDEVLSLTPNTFDWELLQDDLDSLWNSQFTGGNQRVRDFEAVFQIAMEKLGVDYEIIDGKELRLTNIDTLLNYLSKYNPSIEVIHSKPRVYTPEMIKQIREYFSEIPQGVIEARNRAHR